MQRLQNTAARIRYAHNFKHALYSSVFAHLSVNNISYIYLCFFDLICGIYPRLLRKHYIIFFKALKTVYRFKRDLSRLKLRRIERLFFSSKIFYFHYMFTVFISSSSSMLNLSSQPTVGSLSKQTSSPRYFLYSR